MKAKHLVILDFATMTHRQELTHNCFYELAETVDCYALTEPNETIARIGDADAVICNKVLITAEIMDACPNLRYIGLLATGYNNVDIPAADARGITVCNAGSYSTAAVAQMVFSYILDHYSKVALYNTDVRLGSWMQSKTFSYFPYPTMELMGKTLAVIGYGHIGQTVAKIGEAFGMRILIATRTKPEHCPYPVVPLQTAFAEADVLTLHCPLNEGTKDLINRNHLQWMKSNAILINTARGGIVVEQDLADALNEDRIAGAYLDVLATEPMSPNTPLFKAKNCVITPHIAWAPLETRQRLLAIVKANLCAFLEDAPQNVVNHPQAQI